MNDNLSRTAQMTGNQPIRFASPFAQAMHARRFWAGIPAALIIIATLFIFNSLRSAEQKKQEITFANQTQFINNGLRGHFNDYLETVQSIASFFTAAGEVERGEFNSFVARNLAQFGGIQALEWIPRVPHSDRVNHEKLMQNAGFEGFQFKQWTPNGDSKWTASTEKWSDEYYPVYFLQPHNGNESAFGIDLGSNPTRRDALERARNTNKPVATGRITLAQESGEQAGILICVPVFSSSESTIPGEKDLRGFALGVFRFEDIVQAVIGKQAWEHIELKITDESAKDGQRLLFDSQTNRLQNGASFKENPPSENLLASYPFEIGNRQWNFDFKAGPSFVRNNSSHQSWLFLISGILLATVVGGTLNIVIVRLGFRREQAMGEREHEFAERQRADRDLERKVFDLQSLSEELKANQLATLNMMDDIEASRLQLDVMNKALRRSNLELEQFAYIASHDLQEPLRKVASFCGLLRQEYGEILDEDGKSYVDFAIDGATRMRSLVQDLLLFSKIGSQKNRQTPVHTDKALQLAIANLAVAIQESDAVITCDDLPKVCAEERELVQLFQNLIGNAIKYRSDQPPKIHVGIERQSDSWQISISDNGIGIAAEFHKRIFGVFKRLHTRNEYPGTGIGLAICKRIIDQLDGNIWVEPTNGPGTTISFTIPTNATNIPNLATYQPEGSNHELVSITHPC